MKLAQVDKPKMITLLNQLSGAVEELLLSGLTTASESTKQTLSVTFQEAARAGFLRLGTSLRIANEELGRYTRNDPTFSSKRFSFFLNRSWLLSQGLLRAIKNDDQQQFERLLWAPATKPVSRLELVMVGVGKKVAVNTFCAFEFRFRTLNDFEEVGPAGTKLVWSCVFPIKAGSEIPPEGYLHLPQKQKFFPSILLEQKQINIENATMSTDGGTARILLGQDSLVTVGEAFTEWESFLHWDAPGARERIRASVPGPLDLDIEMQEEVVLKDWKIIEDVSTQGAANSDQSSRHLTVVSGSLIFSAVMPGGADGDSLYKCMLELRDKEYRPPLYGVMHYERCKLMLQPLTIFPVDAPPVYMTISSEKIDRAVLLKAMKF